MTRRAGGFGRWCLAAFGVAACSHAANARPASPAPVVARDTVALERDSLLRLARSAIAGRESEAATQVFDSVRVLTHNVSAGNLLSAMNFYGVALGVSCSHCHVVGQYAAEDNPKKAIARQMMRMNGVINGELLPAIPGLKGPNPAINCVTCHRGQVTPAKALSR